MNYNTCNDGNISIAYSYDYRQKTYLSEALNLINAMDYNTILELTNQMSKIIEKKKQDMYNCGRVACSNRNY